MIKNITAFVTLVALLGGVSMVDAGHKWSKYHWNISTAQSETAPLELGNNLTTPAWSASLASASADWNNSVLYNQVVTGSNTACDPVLGTVQVCNAEYGKNNWLGIAQVWVYVGRSGHIAQALVKMNDTYFNDPAYDTAAWRTSVMCQEVGHTYGLGHQDENFGNANLGTCMDYTNDPDGTLADPNQLSNLHPNQHDYGMLVDIYAHLNETADTSGSGNGNGKGNGKKNKPAGMGADIDLNNPSAWGSAVSQDARGNNSLYEKNLGNGQTLYTFVIWAE